MRILHLLDHSPPRVSRYTRRVMAVLRQQRALGWQTCHLTGPRHASFAGAANSSSGDPLWHFYRTTAAVGRLAPLPLFGAVDTLARRLHHVVQLTRPDLLHAHSPCENALAALRVGRRHRLPVVFEAHAPAPFSAAGSVWARSAPALAAERRDWQAACGRFALRALEAWAAARAGAVITNSEGMRRRLHDGGVAACKITVVPDALDLARYAPSAGGDMGLVDGGALIGVSIGMAASESCFQLMLAALALLRKRWTGARLLVACDARQLAALRALAMRRALAGQVTALLRAGAREADNGAVAAAGDWQAMVSAAPTAQLHRLADIVVFPQAAMQAVAAPPHKLLEAMARGCVIAAADTPAHRSLIEHGRSGLLFSADDAAALADALDVLLRGRAGWPAMAAGARWFIEYQRSWEVCAARYVPVYEGLLARRR